MTVEVLFPPTATPTATPCLHRWGHDDSMVRDEDSPVMARCKDCGAVQVDREGS